MPITAFNEPHLQMRRGDVTRDNSVGAGAGAGSGAVSLGSTTASGGRGGRVGDGTRSCKAIRLEIPKQVKIRLSL
jgi:hypothetical protein